MNINIISQYKGLRRENYILCFGRLVTAMGAMVRPMLTMILSQKLGMNAVQVAWVTALMGILSIPANLIGGKMADRFSKKMNIVYLDIVSVVCYIINCFDVSLLLACLSLGHGSEKFKYILSTSSFSKTS